MRYLCDEHVAKALAVALSHREPAVEVYYVGEPGAPPYRTPDPDLIRFAGAEGLTLLTLDRNTLLGHLNDHWAAGGHTWGVFLLKPGASWQRLIDDLLLIWSASEAEDWRDRVEYLPW